MEVAVKGKAKRRHLSADECRHRAEGTDVLTHPHTSNQGTSNHNGGLYPRTPTKRRKHAPSGSPSLHQKRINSFFPVTGVVTSSPHKSPQPSTSTCSKETPTAVRQLEEEDESNEEDDDDISLLATPLALGPDLEENEEIEDNLLADCLTPEGLDDVSLMDGSVASEPEATQQHEVDYLEGMTAEMFGNDEDFEKWNVSGEEEVEALPDAHYGLLGSSQGLVQPQGSIQDLPEEVLRQVLCLLPAQDLYRSACLVCHHWKNIVQDATFMPYKKQYYRYMMKEEESVRDILNLLKNHNISTNNRESHFCMRKLVIIMAQHGVRERVNPDDVLTRVRRHRLYSQAEASIRLRIPEILRSHRIASEELNPYAAMAVILTLSENVGDVQDLASLLLDCLSLTAITEYLSHMATMLLGLERNRIRISNKLHYNIFYVLHLLENGPFFDKSRQIGTAQFHLTREQQQILSHDIQPDHVVKIIAFAGTGKTSTLVKYAEQRPSLRFLYVAFNNSVACEARRSFPRNVVCKTIHSLAFNDIGRRYKMCHKLTCNVKPFALFSVLPKGRGGFVKSKVVEVTLNTFMASAAPVIDHWHVPLTLVEKGKKKVIDMEEKLLFVSDAQRIWSKMQDLNERSKEAYYMTHDGYLKLWQMQNPKPRLWDKYDVLFIDEAQDCTPAIMDVLMAQQCGKILVGDPHQQIYTFKGAVNALAIVAHSHLYYLTQSFRFGSEIAYVGATLLKVCKDVNKILVGGKQKGGVCDDAANAALEAVRTGVSPNPGRVAILCRCNFGVFTEAVQLLDANPRCRLHIIGDVRNIGLNKVMDVYTLLQQAQQQEQPPTKKHKSILDPVIRSFARQKENGFRALKIYVLETDDKELEAKVSIVEKYRERIPALVEQLKQCHRSDFHLADFIVGTVHKAKGLEFDTVVVRDDFVKIPSSRHNWSQDLIFSISTIPADEWNLLYVAVTRTRTTLVISKNIGRILTWAGDYPLKSVMPTTAMSLNPPPCSILNCPNCITPGSAFTIYKQPMKYTDGSSEGGPLCERCVWLRVGPIAYLMTDDVLSMAHIPERFHRPMYNFIIRLHEFL